MAIESRDILKGFFQTGDVPTAEQFGDVIDSYIHQEDDNVTIYLETGSDYKRLGIGNKLPSAPLGITADGDNEDLAAFNKTGDDEATWFFNLNPADSGNPGFNIDQVNDLGNTSRFFIQESDGYIGMGITTPDQKLHIQESTGNGVTGVMITNTATVENDGFILGHGNSPISEQDGAFSIYESSPIDANNRFTIRTGGNVGIREVVPDTILHISADLDNTQTDIDLFPGTGIVTIGPMVANIVADYRGIQARTGEPLGDTYDLDASELNLQRMGGGILIHGDDSILETSKVVITNDAKVGIGKLTPGESIESIGAIKIGTSIGEANGTIRYTGSDFEGRVDDTWYSLTGGPPPPPFTPWEPGTGNTIYYLAGTADAKIGVGILNPAESIEAIGAIKIGDAAGTDNGTIRYTGTDFEGRVGDEWLSLTPSFSPWEQGTGNTIYYLAGTADAKIGVGVLSPAESIESVGAIKIGDAAGTDNGTIRYTGTDFEGRVGDEWLSLTPAPPAFTPWVQGTGNTIYYFPGTDSRIAVGSNTASATLDINDSESVTAGSKAAVIYNQATTSGSLFTDYRVALELKSFGSYSSATKNMGLYIPDVSGIAESESNIAAMLNGNVAIGDVSTSEFLGAGADRVLSIQNGTAPTPPSGTAISVQLYSANLDGIPTLHVMRANGEIVKLYKETGLTEADETDLPPDTYTTATVAIIENMRTRIDELENRLMNIGLLGDPVML